MKELGYLLVLVVLILSGCSVSNSTVYEPGQYKTSVFKPQEYNLNLLDNDKASPTCGIYVLPNGGNDFIEVGTYKPGIIINMPLSDSGIKGFEVSGCQFTMDKS